MRVKEIKAELSKLNIPTRDLFEKEDLVKRLLEVRKNGRNLENVREPATSSSTGSDVLVAPLYFANMDSELKVAAVNMDGGIRVDPSDQPYATVEFEVTSGGAGGNPFKLRLLLDTACSGFVLRPSVVEKYNLPKISTPVTMTGAGGTVGATGLTQLSKFSLGGESFGPLPAAVQDIGALPSTLDGIVGLSFLGNFAAVDMDFAKGEISLHKRCSTIADVAGDRTLVARGTMDLIPQLGIYTVEVILGSRGPVKMLVDSGAASTFLNWKGVSDLGLSTSDNSFLQRLSNPMGAMGSDNIAMQLTHRIGVSSSLNLGPNGGTYPGLSLKEAKRLKIDIGNIAILETIKGHNVGGILGIDALMRATCVRLIFDGASKEILMYQ